MPEMKMSEKSIRRNNADIVKGFAIIAVAIYHLVYRKQGGYVDRGIREAIYLVLPLFFFITGTFYKKGKRTFFESLKRRIKNLLLPSVTVMAMLLIVGAVYFRFVYKYTLSTWFGDVLFTYLRPEFVQKITMKWGDGGQLFFNLSPVWFIWTMFFATILFFAVAEFALKDKIKYQITMICLFALGCALYLLLPPTPWSISLAPIYAAIMLLGAAAGKINIYEKFAKIPPLGMAAIFVAGVAVHVLIFNFCGTDLIYTGNIGSHGVLGVFLFFVQTLVGGAVLFVLANVFMKLGPVGKAVEYVGRHSLTFLLYHCFFGGIAMDIMQEHNKPGPYWYVEMNAEIFIKSLISFAVGIGGCVLMCQVKKKLNK